MSENKDSSPIEVSNYDKPLLTQIFLFK